MKYLIFILLLACSASKSDLPNQQAPAPGSCEVVDYTQQDIGAQGLWYRSTWGRYTAENVFWDGSAAVFRVNAGVESGGELNTTSADYTQGSHKAVIRTTNEPGTVTGWFYYKGGHGEIDMEILSRENGPGTGRLHLVIHPNTGPDTYEIVELGFNPSDAFHEYRFDWHPDRVEFYVDGILVADLTSNIPWEGGTILLNHWTNGDPGWSGGPPSVDAYMYVQSTEICSFASSEPDAGPSCPPGKKKGQC